MNGNLIVAVPSKGRLQEPTAGFFAEAGLELSRDGGARDYRGAFGGVGGVEVLFLPAAEIAARLAAGTAHLGVTGEDLLREGVAGAETKLALIAPLGFGRADVIVAVPRAWIDVRCMADLDDVAAALHARSGRRMRVATKYVNLTRRFFGGHGLVDYRIVESAGATEGAPAAGIAEIVVDISTTGATLAANALKTLDDGLILRSEAHLVASLTAAWSDANCEAARSVLQRVTAQTTASKLRMVGAELPEGTALAAVPEAFGAQCLGGAADRARFMRFLCSQDMAARFCDWLIGNGAVTATVAALDFVYTARNELWETLRARLDRQPRGSRGLRDEPGP